MKAFISYSHKDGPMLEILHKHLAQLKRDGVISTWTDEVIPAGSRFEQQISSALNNSNLFLALLSPDYIASNYCYEKEFQYALQKEEKGEIVIVPIILEPCDWPSTPFAAFKALPKDGKPVSAWENINTAFLDVIQNIRRLIENSRGSLGQQVAPKSSPVPLSRNYRVQKDFDSIEKMDFVEKTFHEVKEYLKRYIDEIVQMDNIKARILGESSTEFQTLIVNRNKIATESKLQMKTGTDRSGRSVFSSEAMKISYSIEGGKSGTGEKYFYLAHDDFHLFWTESSYPQFPTGREREKGSKEIAEIIWSVWLESVGIL